MEISPTLQPARLDELLAVSAARHQRLCPRQVLGVRIGFFAGRLLKLSLPRPDKRLLAIAETDGCFVDGLSAATGCYVGRRTLRVEDYGKTAATLIDTLTEQAVRISTQHNVRSLAWAYARSARNRWEAQLIGYQSIPDELLLRCEWVDLIVPVKQILGQAGGRVLCELCQEEIINQREEIRAGVVLCRSCAGEPYYRSQEPSQEKWKEVLPFPEI